MSLRHHTIVPGVTQSRAQPPLRPRRASRRTVRRQSQRRHTTTYTATQAPAHTRTSMSAPSDQPLTLDTAGGEAAGTGATRGRRGRRAHNNPSRWCWVRRAAGRRARGRDQGPARTTNANRKHRHVRRPNTRRVIDRLQGQWKAFVEFARLPSPVAGNVDTHPFPTFATSGLLDSQV